VLLDSRSRAVVEHPTYPTLYRVPRTQQATVDLFGLRPEENWQPDWQRLRAMMNDGADLLAITHPNNPTGSTITADELHAAIRIAHDSTARLISDETYRLLTDGDPLPPAASADPSAVSISTMSKTYGLPGLRIGWIACRDTGLMKRLVACREHITITNNTLGEHIALEVLRSAQAYIARARDRVTRNRAVVAAHPRLDWVPPVAGVVVFPWITGASEAQCRDLYRRMAEDRKTLVIPGSGFELPDTYFRIGFGADPAELRTGLGQLTAALEELGSAPAVHAPSGRARSER
jgi:aspartate/methionine/tyrosine aminotransferase